MIRNFLAGLLWGTVVAGLGLAVISQVAPMPQRAPADMAADPVATPEALDPAAVPETVTTEAAPETSAVQPAPETAVTEAAPETATPEALPETAAKTAKTTAPADPVSATPPAAEVAAPTAPAPSDASSPAPALAADQASPATIAAPSAQPDAQGSDPAPAKADLPPPAPSETAEALLTPAPEPETAPEPAKVAPEPVTPEATMPETGMADPMPEVIAPDTTLPKAVDGVTTGRLPAIGKADPAPEAAPTPKPPIEQFARAFDNPTAKPMFAVVLIDTAAADLDRARLAALPFPVTFAIDPAAENAAAAAQIYRAAGQEVVMLATGIPAGATAADLEQTFQSNAATLPEAVAVLDLATDGFQDNRPLATMVVPVLQAQGRGLLTFDKGLNAADQVARREGLRAATIFRSLDAEGEDTPLIRRYLDRAAFKAAQEGRVIVIGQTRDETVAALLEWTVEGRAASVALAPLTAVLIAPN